MLNLLIRHSIRAFFPRTESLPGVQDTGLSTFIVEYRRETPWLMELGLFAATLAFVVSPIVTVFVPLPSFLLPKTLLDKHAHNVTSSRIYLLRQAVVLLKMAGGLCWGRHPKVREAFAMKPYPADPGTWRT